MRSSMTSLASFAFLTAWLIKGVAAGAGANVRLCIWLDVEPFEQIDINFTTCTSASRCMYCKRDQDVSLSTKKKGLSCTQENNFYVESKAGSSGGDMCLTDRSYWDVVFTGPGIFSGQLTTQWVGFDTVKIVPERNTYKTAICAAPGQCESYSTSWKSGEVGNIWIVVFPYTFGKRADGSSEGAMTIEGDERDVRARLENM